MTTRARLLAVTMAILMLATSIVITSPAAIAQDTVPTKTQVVFEPLPNLRQFLYPRFDNGAAGQPSCTAEAAKLRLAPAPTPTSGQAARTDCRFPAGAGAAAAPGASGSIEFVTPPDLIPNRRIALTGNTSFRYTHSGTIPTDVTLTVSVKTEAQEIAQGVIRGDSANPGRFPVDLIIAGPTASTGRVFIEPNRTVTLSIVSSAPDLGLPAGGVSQPLTWEFDDERSSLEIRADDAVRAATWITDEKDALKTVFAPIANNSLLPADADRRIVGHFALQSAFGFADAAGDAPQFSILLDGRSIELASGGRTILTGVENASASVSQLGVRVWSFPASTVNYRGFQSGDYVLHVEKSHHQGAPIGRQTDKRFSITAQSVRLEPYTDARFPALQETQAHAVQAGGSTTYILAVNNTGSVNDTFTINVTAPNAPQGWGVSVAGPDVLSRTIFVPTGETRVFKVTVNAPFAATGEVIHLVNVTSSVDPGARSRDLTLVTTVRNELVREVGIIVLQRDLTLDPGVEARIPVYIWNRGTRISNASIEILESVIAGWTVDLAFGNANVHRLVLSSIQPGDIAEATLKVTGPLSAAVPSHSINLNATITDASGISTDRPMTFTLRSQPGVSLKILNAVGTADHLAELIGRDAITSFGGTPADSPPSPQCDGPPPQGPCQFDHLDGLWYRVWVSNSGRQVDSFDLSADTFVSNCRNATLQNSARPPVFPTTGLGGQFGFFHRNPSGAASAVGAIGDLPPGKTAEIYVFVPVLAERVPCSTVDGTSTETFTFVVQAKGRGTGATARAGVTALARNEAGDGGGRMGVLLEGVVREAGYSPSTPYVDITNASTNVVIGAVEPGKNLTYYVRMTNLASWSDFVDGDGGRHAPDMKISLSGVKYEDGWNVSIRPVLAGANDLLNNPYGASYNMSNQNPASDPTLRREGWFDRELEVVVQSPNTTSVAKRSHEFQILATTNTSNHLSALVVTTIIAEQANVSARADQSRIFAHPGQQGAYLLYVNNSGSSEAEVTLRASMAEGQSNVAQWQISPNEQRFTLPAFKNRTIALLVTPPVTSSQGTTGDLNVTLEYARTPALPNVTTNVSLRLTTEVVQPGTLTLTPRGTDATTSPGGTANFTMTLRNSGSLATPFRVVSTPIPNWTVAASPEQGTLQPGETRTVVLVLVAPGDVTNESRFASIVRVEEPNNAQNFDSTAFTVNILGGTALPKLFVPNLVKRVDRNGVQSFEVQVQNAGSAQGRLSLEARVQDPRWQVGIVDSRGNNITGVELRPNELTNINVTVKAPFDVPERTVTPIEIIAYSPRLTELAKATLQAEIHDYAVQISLVPSSKDALPGLPTEFTIKLRNIGNENDTLNVSADLTNLPEWSVQLTSEEVRLEPGQEAEIRATIRSPTGPLPAPRTYTFPFWVGTRGGQTVNLPKNMTTSAVVTVPNYRAFDVDKDGQLELAIDLDKRASNGFEEFRDVFSEGVSTQVVAKAIFENKTTFFLDLPNPPDGLADIWFNPETVYAFEITQRPDVNGDGTPEYFIDADRDGKLEKAFDTASEQFWDVVEIKVYADERIQYLVDTNRDGRPDRFFDPETNTVTRTQRADNVGTDYVGIDIDDDDRVDYYYNTRTKQTTGAEVSNVGSFAVRYWYFFVAFAALIVLTVILIVRRRK